SCYRVLLANGDPRADALLHAAAALLEQQANWIADRERRHVFLHQVAAHRALLAAVATAAPLTATPQQQIERPRPSVAPSPLHNLPSPSTSFVGRVDELANLAALLASDTRLITVVGAGGAGKTRLALALAWQLREQFADGVWWVALAALRPAGDQAFQRATL